MITWRNHQTRVRDFIALVFILGAGAYLRLDKLGAPSLWLDEIVNVDLTAAAPRLRWWQWLIGFERENGPLYYLTQLASLGCCSTIEAAFRLPAALFGIGTVAVLFFAGRRVGGSLVGLVGSLLLAISPLHVYYSREGRPYAMLMFAAALLALLFLEIEHRFYEAGAWATLIAVAYTAATAAPITIAAFLVAMAHFLRTRPQPIARRWLSMAGASAFATALIVLLYGRFEQPSAPLGFGLGGMRNLIAGFTTTAMDPSTELAVPALVWVLALTGSFSLLPRARGPAMTLIGLFVLPIGVALTFLWMTNHWFSLRYFSSSLPAFLLLVAAGIAWAEEMVGRKLPRLAAVGVTAVATLLITPIVLQDVAAARVEPFQKADWRALASSLWMHARTGDTILAENDWSTVCLRFYLRRYPPKLKVIDVREDVDLAKGLLARRTQAWLVSGGFARNDAVRQWMCHFFLVDHDPREQIRAYFAPDAATFLNERATRVELARFSEAFHRVRRGRLTMGREDDLFFRSGWFPPEIEETDPFRWAGRRAELLLPSYASQQEIRFLASAVDLPGNASQTIELRMNNQLLARETMQKVPAVYRFLLPPSRPLNRLELIFSGMVRPSDTGVSADPRKLAAAFDWIEIGSPGGEHQEDGRRRETLFRPDRVPLSPPGRAVRGEGTGAPLHLAIGYAPEAELNAEKVRRAFTALECVTDEQFVHSAFLVLLHRSADPAGRRFYLRKLREGTSRDKVLRMFLSSPEFRELWNLTTAASGPRPTNR